MATRHVHFFAVMYDIIIVDCRLLDGLRCRILISLYVTNSLYTSGRKGTQVEFKGIGNRLYIYGFVQGVLLYTDIIFLPNVRNKRRPLLNITYIMYHTFII